MTSLSDYAFYGLQILPAVAAVLFPAALLARHPDAATRMPVLLLGTILFALVQLLLILATPLAPSFEAATPATDDVPFVAMAELYNGLTLAVAALGLGFIARGLSLARQFEDRTGPGSTGSCRSRRLSPRCSGSSGPPGSSLATRSRDRVGLHRLERLARDPARGGMGISAGQLRCAALLPARTRAPAGASPRWGAGIVLFALVLVNLVGLVEVPEAWIIDLLPVDRRDRLRPRSPVACWSPSPSARRHSTRSTTTTSMRLRRGQ